MVTKSVQQFKAELFRALAHASRIRILELLRIGEMSVSELQLRLGIEPASVSQQLGVLRSQELVAFRKEGSNVYYCVRDPVVFDLLDAARVLFNSRVTALHALAQEEDAADSAVQAEGGGASAYLT